MAIDRDDIIGEQPINGSSGRTCNHAEILISDDRILTIRFDESDVTVLGNGTAFHRQRNAGVIVQLYPPETEFSIYNRRHNTPTQLKRTYEQLSRDIMSLYLHTVAQGQP